MLVCVYLFSWRIPGMCRWFVLKANKSFSWTIMLLMWANPEWDRLSGPSLSTHSFNSICFEAEILTLSRSIEFVLHYKRHFSHDREAYYVGCLVFFLPFLPGLSWESRLFLNVSAARSGLLSHSLDHSISWLMMCCFESRNWSLGTSLVCSSWLGSGFKRLLRRLHTVQIVRFDCRATHRRIDHFDRSFIISVVAFRKKYPCWVRSVLVSPCSCPKKIRRVHRGQSNHT